MDSSRFFGIMCREWTDAHQFEPGGDQMDATTIAVDLAKNVFEIAVANDYWRVVQRHRQPERDSSGGCVTNPRRMS